MAVIDRYYVGQGDALLFERNASGKRVLGRKVGNAPVIKISGSQEELKHIESRTGLRKTDNKIIWGNTMMVNVTIDNFSAENLAWIMSGTAAEVNAGSVTGEVQKYSSVMQLDRFNVTPATVLARKVGAVADWAGSTFNVQPSGVVEILTDPPAVGVVPGDDISFAYSYGAHDTNYAFTRGNKEFWFSTHAINKADNDAPVLLDCFRVVFKANFEFDAIGETYGTLSAEGELLLDPYQPASTGQYYQQRNI